jgi:nucleoside-diphosphate-sugar epimerase
MRAFVIGATGYIGRSVTQRLRAAGHTVTGLARSDAAVATLKELGATSVRGGAEDPAVLAAEARAVDVVIYVASLPNAATAERGIIEGIVQTLAGTNKGLVYTSGVWVTGDTGNRVADEETPLRPPALVAWRPAVERVVLDSSTHGIRAVVLRPGIVYGNAGSIPAMLSQSVREHGVVRYVGTGENHWAAVHIDDLADLYLRATERAPTGTLLNAVDDRPYVVRELAVAASEGAGTGVRTESWPLPDARQTLGPFADALAMDQLMTAARARTLLGWSSTAPSLLDELRLGSYAHPR